MAHYAGKDFVGLLQKKESCLKIFIVANKYTIHIFIESSDNSWNSIGCGDLDDALETYLLKNSRKKHVTWLEMDIDDLESIDPLNLPNGVSLTENLLRQWGKTCDNKTLGRKGDISPSTQLIVGKLSAWRCQMCGTDLKGCSIPGRVANYGYLAHIVASSDDGPRGKEALPDGVGVNDADNLMHLCDKCHRLIDRVAPMSYPANSLRAIRSKSIQEVSYLLDSLVFPQANMLAVLGNIEGQTPLFDEQKAVEALWSRKLRKSSVPVEMFGQHSPHIGTTHTMIYWGSFFELLKLQIPKLRDLLIGTAREEGHNLPLAIFPLHAGSLLILLGRLIGDSRPVYLFQVNRNYSPDAYGGRWAWPNNVQEPIESKYRLNTLRSNPISNNQEGLFLVCLTAAPATNELPEHFYKNEYCLPTLELTVDQPMHNVISHPKDLELLRLQIDAAMNIMQDQWRLKTIHLVVIAPTTACVCIGQKMQARHHADYILYERNPVPNKHGHKNFEKTIKISSTEVEFEASATKHSIPIA